MDELEEILEVKPSMSMVTIELSSLESHELEQQLQMLIPPSLSEAPPQIYGSSSSSTPKIPESVSIQAISTLPLGGEMNLSRASSLQPKTFRRLRTQTKPHRLSSLRENSEKIFRSSTHHSLLGKRCFSDFKSSSISMKRSTTSNDV